MNQTVMNRLDQCLENVLEIDIAEIQKISSFTELQNWDSLRYMSLLVALESEFELTLERDEIELLVSYTGIVEILSKHLVI